MMELSTLKGRFGRYGARLYELARGIDKSEVIPNRPTQSISAEDTFEHDVPLKEAEPMIASLRSKHGPRRAKNHELPGLCVETEDQ